LLRASSHGGKNFDYFFPTKAQRGTKVGFEEVQTNKLPAKFAIFSF
jgi:hypothetical protein